MSVSAWTFNVQHGQGSDEQFNYQRQVDRMVGDLFAIQERSGSETGWDTPMSNAGIAQAIYRANQIGGSDGNAIWYKSSTVTILSTYEVQLSIGAQTGWSGTNVDKCAVAAKVQMEGQRFYFVGTHLCQAAGADSNGALTSTIRENQMKALLRFMDDHLLGLDIVIAADFNYGPNYLLNNNAGFQMDLFLRAGFQDLWRTGMTAGSAFAPWADLGGGAGADLTVSDNTITHDTRRIDGVYLKTVNRALRFDKITVPDFRVTCSQALSGDPLFCPDVPVGQRTGTVLDYGVRPTDHNPVEAQFTINQQAASPVHASQFSWMPNLALK